jgi:hypothetical protein
VAIIPNTTSAGFALSIEGAFVSVLSSDIFVVSFAFLRFTLLINYSMGKI